MAQRRASVGLGRREFLEGIAFDPNVLDPDAPIVEATGPLPGVDVILRRFLEIADRARSANKGGFIVPVVQVELSALRSYLAGITISKGKAISSPIDYAEAERTAELEAEVRRSTERPS